jgi:hypothetical protein
MESAYFRGLSIGLTAGSIFLFSNTSIYALIAMLGFAFIFMMLSIFK